MNSKINNELARLLREYLKRNGYYSSGKLSKSIKFDVTYSKTQGFNLGLTAKEYILYLDNGKLLDKWLSETKVKEVIADFVSEELLKSLD